MASRTAIPFAFAAGLLVAYLPAAAQTPPLPVPQNSYQYPNQPVVPPTIGGPFNGIPSIGSEPPTELYLSEGTPVQLPNVRRQQTIRFSPRYGSLGELDWQRVDAETQRLVYTGGLIINVRYPVPGPGITFEIVTYEFAADNLVAWLRNAPAFGMNQPVEVGGDGRPEHKMQLELYLTGNVVVRSREIVQSGGRSQPVDRILRADCIYYDVDANKAIAQKADLEMVVSGVSESVHLYAEEMQRLGRYEWKAVRGGAFSSKLPSDPGIRMEATDLTYTETRQPQRNFLGITYRDPFDRDNEPSYERTLTGHHARVTFAGVPVFYTPYLKTDLAEPLGPLRGIGFGQDRVFGTQLYSTWDIYKLIAVRAPSGHDWRLLADILGDRGPGIGTEYDARSPSFFGYGGRAGLAAKYYGLPDGGKDQLGPRGPEPERPAYRFRSRVQYLQDLYIEREEDTFLATGADITLQSQFGWVSDKNFLEQFFYQEHAYDVNLETFAYLKGTQGQFFGSVLAQGGQSRKWVTETRWLPRADLAVIGQSFFDLFVYNAKFNAGYAELRPATIFPFPVLPTEQRIDTGRVDLTQELSVPLDLGPFRVAPYGLLDLTAYSEDLTGESRGRVIGSGGVRSSLTLSRVYQEASSELFNVHGLNHKVTLTGNYHAAESNTPYTQLPLLDRLNDDATDLGYRNIQPFWQDYVPADVANELRTNPRFNPQRYAIRRLVGDRVDTRDDIQVVRLGVDQRLQTKRGFPGQQHTVDFLTLNVAASVFPDADRDNFGHSVSFLEYYFLWNAGDRTAVQSSGWFDPQDPGVRYYNVGVYMNRPDNTSFFFGYRQLDPVNSKAVMGGVSYQLSPKYSFAVDVAYDFGTQQALSNTLTLSRVGKDLTIGVGFTYNAIVNNFGFQFSILPNLAAGTGYRRVGSPQLGGANR